jgi:peptidoglycan DL-endopeptidase CwlO
MRRLLLAVLCLSAFYAFPSNAGAYDRCSCTAWAHSKRPDLPLNLGNAKTWGVRAAAQGFPVDNSPRVGDIMVLRPGVQGASRVYGHVAYVIAVNGSKVTVSEMNSGGGCSVVRDTFKVSNGTSFIHSMP